MSHCPVRAFLSILFLLCIVASQSGGQWSTDPTINNAICTAAGDQKNLGMISDGAGGAIIVWQDERSGPNTDIYAQRISASGVAMWRSDGVAISVAAGEQMYPRITSDGAGGAIIAWQDTRSGGTVAQLAGQTTNTVAGSSDIYAQHINSAGTTTWTANGVAVTTATGDQLNPALTTDGAGGAIITWEDKRNGSNYDIYVQRIGSSGGNIWTANGVPISTAANDQKSPRIISDGTNGAIIAWTDLRSATNISNIYVQRIDASGRINWATNGTAICPSSGNQASPNLTNDGGNGAIVTWMESRSGSTSIFAQRISNGALMWNPDGVKASANGSAQYFSQITQDGSGGAIVAWEDFHNSSHGLIYSQRISVNGYIMWGLNGIPISSSVSSDFAPLLCSDGTGGAIITWNRLVNDSTWLGLVARISSSGDAMWKTGGVQFSTASITQIGALPISDGAGGAILTWMDGRNGVAYDIYAQKLDQYGYWGKSAPTLAAVRDIANDQGGKLRVFWEPSYLDGLQYQTIASYDIMMGTKLTGVLGKSAVSNGSTIYWQKAGSAEAMGLGAYSYAVTTYADSGLQGIPRYYFQIVGRNSNLSQSWFSNIDSGYSVDNIPPVGVARASIGFAPNGTTVIRWEKNRVDPDLMGYKIYRSSTSGFAPDRSTELSMTEDTVFVDVASSAGKPFYYKIAAMDIHGNLGAASTELYLEPMAVDGDKGSTPTEFTLHQNYPNPFNPSTTISFSISEKSFVSLEIFDALGKNAAVLVSEELSAGSYTRLWNAAGCPSGVYFYRLQAGSRVELKRLVLLK
jgi:hypothetical protein